MCVLSVRVTVLEASSRVVWVDVLSGRRAGRSGSSRKEEEGDGGGWMDKVIKKQAPASQPA